MTVATKVLLAVVATLTLVSGVLYWRMRAAQHDTAEAAVAPAKAVAADAKVEEQQAGVALTARVDTVTRWLHDTVTVPERVLHPVTHEDTASAVAALPMVHQKYEGCRAQLTSLVTDCEAFHIKAARRASADSVVIVKQDALLRDRPPRRHWMPCVAGGYGAGLHGGMIATGPSVTVGLCWTPF